MRIISLKRIKMFYQKHKDAEQPLKIWCKEVSNSNWNSPNDVKNSFNSASILKNNRIVFNIKGNEYRLITVINYDYKIEGFEKPSIVILSEAKYLINKWKKRYFSPINRTSV